MKSLAIVMAVALVTGCASKPRYRYASDMPPPDNYFVMPEKYVPLDSRVAELIPACDPPSERLEDACAGAAGILRAETPQQATERFLSEWRDAVAHVRRTEHPPESRVGDPVMNLSGVNSKDAIYLLPLALVLAAGAAAPSGGYSTVKASEVHEIRRVQLLAIRHVYAQHPDDPYCAVMIDRLAFAEASLLYESSIDSFEAAHRALSQTP